MSFGVNHVILTRFNVSSGYAVPGVSGTHPGLDEGWLERRFALFETFCLPSVVRQTQRDFRWLVFFDERTPERYRTRVREWAAQYDFFLPVFCEVFDNALVLDRIRDLEARQTGIRITSRLDNDDMLHPRYVEKMRAIIERHLPLVGRDAEGCFVSFPVGACLHKGAVYVQRYRYNPFTSCVAPATSERTALDVDHRYVAQTAPVYFDWRRPMWCQVIHGENVANALRGVYWPMGSAFAKAINAIPGRSFGWRAGEVFRSAWRYLRKR